MDHWFIYRTHTWPYANDNFLCVYCFFYVVAVSVAIAPHLMPGVLRPATVASLAGRVWVRVELGGWGVQCSRLDAMFSLVVVLLYFSSVEARREGGRGCHLACFDRSVGGAYGDLVLPLYGRDEKEARWKREGGGVEELPDLLAFADTSTD